MNKKTKGAIAAGAAAVLLAGGAGTMAAWNSSASLPSATITAGELKVTEKAGTPGTWTWATAGANSGTTFNPATDKLAPGDSVSYTGTYTLSIVGKNLKATGAVNAAGLTGDLAGDLTITTAATKGGSALNLADLSASDSGDAVVTTTITFKGTADNTTMNKGASLAGATVTLQQTAPAAYTSAP
ncbi:hypothetical protein A5N78_07030 [Prescottella equi]|uniref:alternate-type signal peptide domain-containing protein n=1 Tax=Rhodococcus hoagii TaxID=43767 RepID=UPI000A10D085|nr:alternate-type signal peptide domain-containing protein [Prescottella equi]ORL32652.1 hypothetical protein A6I91_13050 [Prescottella equi]ORL90980.1 hypothetical protein A5N78_07030 [Prescottella equi]ORM22868.1 hypothetical protein A5N70_01495 [Prescottella equi]